MKWVTVARGARDGYQIPLALAERGLLASHVTDFYAPLDRLFYRSLERLVPHSVVLLLTKRHKLGLPSACVRSFPFRAWYRSILTRDTVPFDREVGRLAGRISQRHRYGLLAYNTYAFSAFHEHHGDAGPRLLFQCHPHPRLLLELFGAEIARRPAARKLLANEPELRADPRRLTELEQECFLADHVIAASEFTRHSLIHAGLDPGRISVVPYGVDTRLFPRVADDGSRGGPIRVLFVGQISQRKGILDLLEAWRDCGTQRRSLTLVGRGASALLEAGAPAGIRAFEHLGSSELVQALASHDVLCLPSIAEGFGLVIMEALACGTPVIASCNTGGADVLSDGVDGFILRAGDVPALRSLLSDLAGDPSKVRGMRLAAQLKAESYSWEKFREDIVTVIQRTERDWKSRSQGHGQSRAQPSSDATGRPKGGGSVVDCLGQGAARMKGQLP